MKERPQDAPQEHKGNGDVEGVWRAGSVRRIPGERME